jgi:hypothetical protein
VATALDDEPHDAARDIQAPPVPRAASEGPGGISRVSDKYHARALCAEILNPDRVYPIVGLSCHSGTVVPAMSPERARERIWPTVPIYIIEPRESRTMKELLPAGLDVYNGAVRIWFPGVDANSERGWHPLIYEMSGVYGDEAVERLAGEFAHARPESSHELSANERAVLRLRSLPRPVSGDAPDASFAPIPLATRRDLRRLTTDLRRPDRDYPIVVLTLGDLADEQAFPAEELRKRLEPHIPIYMLGTPDLCRRLPGAVGAQYAVDEGDARVFWPGVTRDGDPAGHPLVPAHGERGSPIDRILAAVELSRPGVRGHVEGTQELLRAAQQRAADALRDLRSTRAELETASREASDARAQSATLEQQLDALRLAGLDERDLELATAMDTDARLHRLIAREWLRALPTADERYKHPLRYVLGSGFSRSVDELTGTPIERTAWVCAMVACGRAKKIPGVEPHHLRSRRGGSNEQLVRQDGAKAWTCKLAGEGASRLQYWLTPRDLVEFGAATVHDSIGLLT